MPAVREFNVDNGGRLPRVRRKKTQDHIPRPRNAFIIFRSHYIKFLRSNKGDNTKASSSTDTIIEHQQNELSKIAAKVWNRMDAEERKPYAEEARREKEWHRMMYPDYVYRAPTTGGDKGKHLKIKMKASKDLDKRASPPTTLEYDFVPTEGISPLVLGPPLVEQELQKHKDKEEPPPPQQPGYDVDLSPRSLLAYDQHTSPNLGTSSAYVNPSLFSYFTAMQMQTNNNNTIEEIPNPFAGSEFELPSTSPDSFAEPTTTTTGFSLPSSNNTNASPSSSSSTSSSFDIPTTTTTFSFTQNLNFPSSVEPIMDQHLYYLPVELEMDVPNMNFEVGGGGGGGDEMDAAAMDAQMAEALNNLNLIYGTEWKW